MKQPQVFKRQMLLKVCYKLFVSRAQFISVNAVLATGITDLFVLGGFSSTTVVRKFLFRWLLDRCPVSFSIFTTAMRSRLLIYEILLVHSYTHMNKVLTLKCTEVLNIDKILIYKKIEKIFSDNKILL